MKAFVLLGLALVFPALANTPSKGKYDKQAAGFYLGHFDSVGDLEGCRDLGNALFRGGRPDLAGSAWSSRLAREEIDYVLDLRSKAKPSAQDAAAKAGLGYILLPLRTSGTAQPSRMELTIQHRGQSASVRAMDPVDATIEVLRLIDQLSRGGHRIYIHCARGEDRTGTILGLLRKCEAWRREFRAYGGSDYAPLTWLRSRVEARSAEY